MTEPSQVFRPSREHVVAIVLMIGIALIGIGWAPLALGWLLIFPVGALAWVLTVSTTVGEQGISLKYLFKRDATIAWDDLDGIAFKGARALATTTDGNTLYMPGVTFNSLPELSAASRGRITDVITGSAEAADGKYEIINREGNKVLLTREEYDVYLREHPDTPGPRPAPSTTTNDKE
ncbi:PH domain-containing protein [Corynebacterium timonense]|uniref:PH domain-containing protein n=1 Tax=Corynebacterium timonense TaxID=441500 RepID=A0A1H1PZD7_9CORY|nr:PH domain-containing protein [Corynebacterium timonense]SDS16464.1 PH domain-containing protein [Corynebacterium timonense]